MHDFSAGPIAAPAGPDGSEGLVPRSLVLFPTLNEAAGLQKTLGEFSTLAKFSQGRTPKVLVVDGRSTDGTLDVAKRLECSVLTQKGRGKGAAIRQGLGWAVDHGYDTVGVLDADATYPSQRLPALFELLRHGADVVVGVRKPDHPSHTTARDLVHRVGNGGLNLAAALFSRGPILDVCSGFWGLHTSLLPRLNLVSDGFEIESELFVKSFRMGLRVIQIPVSYRERTGIAKLQATRDGARIFLSIIRNSAAGARILRAARGSSDPGPTAPGIIRPKPRGFPALVHALVLSLDAAQVRITSAVDRRSEAAELASSLTHSDVGVELLTGQEPGGMPPGSSLGRRWTYHHGWFDHSAPLDVALPTGDLRAGHGGPTAVVAVPRTRQVLRLRALDDAPRPRTGTWNDATFLRRAPPPERVPGIVTILGATIDPSGVKKEIALLAANFSATGLEVYRPQRRSVAIGRSLGKPGLGGPWPEAARGSEGLVHGGS